MDKLYAMLDGLVYGVVLLNTTIGKSLEAVVEMLKEGIANIESDRDYYQSVWRAVVSKYGKDKGAWNEQEKVLKSQIKDLNDEVERYIDTVSSVKSLIGPEAQYIWHLNFTAEWLKEHKSLAVEMARELAMEGIQNAEKHIDACIQCSDLNVFVSLNNREMLTVLRYLREYCERESNSGKCPPDMFKGMTISTARGLEWGPGPCKARLESYGPIDPANLAKTNGVVVISAGNLKTGEKK